MEILERHNTEIVFFSRVGDPERKNTSQFISYFRLF